MKEKKKVNNNKTEKQTSRTLVYFMYTFIILLVVIVAQYFTTRKVNDTVLASISYYEQSNVDYRVFYEENPYYDEAYLGKGGTYVSSLIDKIDVDFDYYVNYSDKLKGKYNYYVRATIFALDNNDSNNIYWQKSFDLTDYQEIIFKDKKDYRIVEKVSVDYPEYNRLLSEYTNTLMLDTKAYLSVELVIENNGTYPGVEPIKYMSNVGLDIPLSERTINMSIKSNLASDEQTINTKEDNRRERVYSKIIAGMSWLLVVILSACFALTYHNDIRKESLYSRKLRKILSTYDNIIVNVEKLPVLNDLSVVNVTTFEELVDAQNEVRLPINFKENKSRHIAKFVLVRNNLAWVYTLKEGDESDKK